MIHLLPDSDPPQDDAAATEAQALARILSWSRDWPTWQRDALRRLCTTTVLTPADLDELTALCKRKGHGAVPLAPPHIPDPGAAAATVSLRSVHGADNVNALKRGERLTFDKVGVTIVYGDNGSGKSGYARILKKVCRARTPPDDKILPNIYSATTGAPQAIIDFTAAGHHKSASWTVAHTPDPLLSSVSVFDSRTASVHVDAVNDVAYTPFPMQVLSNLAEACREIKKRIDAEIKELTRRTPQTIASPRCHDGTAAGKLISALNGSTKERDVQELATLNDAAQNRLATLRSDLANAPQAAARRLTKQRVRLFCVECYLAHS